MEKTTKPVVAQEVEQQPAPFYVRLHQAKQSIGKVHKNATNPHFKKNYADINSIVDAVEPILLQHDILLLQPIRDNVVATQLICIWSKETIESFMTLPIIVDPQKVLSAITYYRRATLQSLLSLQAVDDDGNIAATVKPKLSMENYDKALIAIEDGRYTVDKLKSSYDLTDLQVKALLLLQ